MIDGAEGEGVADEIVDGGFVERRRPEVAEVSECRCTLAVVTLVYQLISSTT